LDGAPGLTDLLRGAATQDHVIQTNSLSNFSFIARGGDAGDPGDLFLSKDLDHLLASWRRDFDFVVIDSCPVFAADDPTTLAPKVDGTLLVVRNRFSRAGAVRQALDVLSQRQARILGLIYNRAETSSRSYYYYKYGEYHWDKRSKHAEPVEAKPS